MFLVSIMLAVHSIRRPCLTSDNGSYGNFAGRDGAAQSGLKMGGRGRQRAPLLLILGKNGLYEAGYFREHATLVASSILSIYPDPPEYRVKSI